MQLLMKSDGAAAVEFAIVAPVFILLVFGMIAYAIYFGAAHSVQQLAGDAARAAVAGLDSSERQNLVKQFISKNGASYSFIDVSKLQYSVGNAAADPTQLAVVLSYDARELPIWGLLPSGLLPDETVTRRVSIRIGGV